MNRLIFSNGGQPLFLGDFKLMQDNDAESMKTLLDALGCGNTAFLLKAPEVTDVSAGTGAGTHATVKGGTAVVDGEFLTWADTEITVKDWHAPIYLCVTETETDSRIFEDGQERACVKSRDVYVGTDNSGAAVSYDITALPLLSGLLKDYIGIKENVWKDINVEFANGYGGTVKYMELEECYRVWINIKSNDFTEMSGTVHLFYSDDPILQCYDTADTGFVQSENGVTSFHLRAFEGTTEISLTLPFDDVSAPGLLPVKIVFEIPK